MTKRLKIICRVCKEVFEVSLSGKDREYCSRECYGLSRVPESFKNHKCLNCNKKFSNLYDKDKVYCSAKCKETHHLLKSPANAEHLAKSIEQLKEGKVKERDRLMQLIQYVLYEKPKDYPDKYVIRNWFIEKNEIVPGNVIIINDTREKAEEYILLYFPSLHWMPRAVADDPCILGVWF